VRPEPASGAGGTAPPASDFFLTRLQAYRAQAMQALARQIPGQGPPYLYDLAGIYPARSGKGLRPALCLAACGALGGDPRRALEMAAAIELFHNGFLIHDDIQDYSECRRGAPTLHCEFGVPIAINVGNATNLLALQQLARNREAFGPRIAWLLFEETQRMMRYSLEGQALELGWIRDNVCALEEKDYLEMCLKKTSWYSFIYPLRVGAIIARGGAIGAEDFCRFGWYLGAAFQVQDDVLNLQGDYASYGKEIAGDLYEGKRTLSLIHLLRHCSASEREGLRRTLAKPRAQRTALEVRRLQKLMAKYGSVPHARGVARQLVGAALVEGLDAFQAQPDSDDKRFILEAVLYVANRDR
jgi:geranylgeranyl diphosphate synthase type II